MQQSHAANQQPTRDNHALQAHTHGQRCILVVEDDRSLARLESDVLLHHGYTVIAVQSGEHAIAQLRRFVPDLVVLDLELSGAVHGRDVLRFLRSGTPVLLTTSSITVTRKYLRSHGESIILEHLAKPYSIQAFLHRVQHLLKVASQ